MRIETVLGPIEPAQAGITLTHEHIKMDYTKVFIEPLDDDGKKKARNGEITLNNLGWVRQYPYSHLFNLALGDEDLDSISKEVERFKKLGGSTIVEATTGGISPDWSFLKKVSEKTKVHIICGAGFYLDATLSEQIKTMSVEELTDVIVKQVTEGKDGIKAGIIGEVGCSYPLRESEKKHLIAASIAQAKTHAPLLIHPGRDPRSPKEIIAVIRENGGDVLKTAMSHLDRTIHSDKDLLELAELGCYLEYDFFGLECSNYQYDSGIDLPSDAQRIRFIKLLIDKGYTSQVVIAHDIHTRHRLARTGAPLLIHPGRSEDSPVELLEIVKQHGGDISKTVMSHLDRTILSDGKLIELAQTGCYLEYDFFGLEVSYYDIPCEIDYPTDAQRIRNIKYLIDNGFVRQLVIAHDIHTRHRLVKYGGHGYGHILEHAVPKMLLRGITQEDVNAILIENPRRWLSY